MQDHCIIPIIGLEKQSRPGHVRGHLRIQSFSDDVSLCPVAALTEYNSRVSFTLLNSVKYLDKWAIVFEHDNPFYQQN